MMNFEKGMLKLTLDLKYFLDLGHFIFGHILSNK